MVQLSPRKSPPRMRSWLPWANRLASSVRPWFVEASPTVEKAVSCYKADRLVALLLSFRSVQSSPAAREFHATKNTANQAMDRCVRTWCHGASELCELSGFTTQEFSMVGGYTENPEKPQNCQNWGMGYGRLLGTIRYCKNVILIKDRFLFSQLVRSL